MKTRLQNQFCEHLDLVVHMFAQLFYTVDIFLYDDVIRIWINAKARKGILA
jgi:hypothetical protein